MLTVQVVEIATQKVVKVVNVNGGERKAEKVERGLLMRVDTDKFYVTTVEQIEEKPT